MIDDWFPDPTIGAGAPRALQLLLALSKSGVAVTHFSTLEAPDFRHALMPSMPSVKLAKTSGSYPALAAYLQRIRGNFDAILISRPHNLRAVREALSKDQTITDGMLTVYDAEAVFSQREILRSHTFGVPMSPEQTQGIIQEELALAECADIVLAVNEANAQLFRENGHGDIRILRHAVIANSGTQPHSARTDILFVGPTYSDETPNTDSVIWFVDLVLPLIRSRIKRDVILTLIGKSHSAAISARMDGRINQHGAKPDLSDAYNNARVFVAPTRFAAGIPLKVYEAAAHGIPCVITSLLATQLNWQHECEALVADTPQAFAEQTIRLYNEPLLWERIRVAALARTLRDCDQSDFQHVVANIFSATSFRRPRP